MAIKVNIKKVKKQIKEKQERAEAAANGVKKRDPRESVLLRPLEAGKQKFRALPYVHNDKPEQEPFAMRHYHYIYPELGTVYCPQENDGQPCAICDLVWGQMKALKGQKELVKKWANYLPKASLFIAGVAIGREDEGVKFLKFGTSKKNISTNHAKLWEWFEDESTEMWMDPEEGLDIEIKYVEASEEQKKRFRTSLLLDEINLGRKNYALENYEEWLEKIPVIEEVYQPIMTSEEVAKKVEQWASKMGVSVPEKSDSEMSTMEVDDEYLDDVAAEDLEDELEKLGL